MADIPEEEILETMETMTAMFDDLHPGFFEGQNRVLMIVVTHDCVTQVRENSCCMSCSAQSLSAAAMVIKQNQDPGSVH